MGLMRHLSVKNAVVGLVGMLSMKRRLSDGGGYDGLRVILTK
tara:strand:+ start:3037 stop:3162 length:126 start_codon:yes stop_codon:yes gene_type:complete